MISHNNFKLHGVITIDRIKRLLNKFCREENNEPCTSDYMKGYKDGKVSALNLAVNLIEQYQIKES